ncbi:MAG: flagellar filament capping protein FliD [Fibromonadaceae bacterium]|jgi:flagellar capping protein FliD|nr:flagellar filament capping protein FliD [Fibromonadaceae bacterium]
MPVMSVGGLASGLDTNNIIAQLTALEQAKVTREVKKKENAQSTLDKFKELETKLLSLQTKAKGLELPKDFNLFKSTSNYEDYATVSGGEGATAGSYELVVKQLATTLKVASNSYSAVNKSMFDLGLMAKDAEPITVTLSTSKAAQKTDPRKTVDIVINSSDTLKDIVNKINAAEGTGVKASIMSMSNGDNRIVLTAVDSGTDGFSIEEKGGTNLFADLGFVSYSDQKATSGSAFTVIGGGPATEATTFKELNTVLNRNNLDPGDKIGIYLPANDGSGSPGWVTFDLFDGTRSRTIKEVLDEINDTLASSTVNASFRAELSNSGEIVIVGNLAGDQNFNSNDDLSSGDPNLVASERTYKTYLQEVKIQLGTFKTNGDGSEEIDVIKKDMGTLANHSVFKEDNIITAGQNAFYTVDGMSITSQSNDDDKTISGTTFTLKKADPDKVIKVSLESDLSGLADKISEFVEEFNELLKFIDENAKAEVVEKADESGKKTSTRVVGPFTGDSGISGLRESLRSMFSGVINELTNSIDNGYSTVYSSASRVGILATKEGYYEVDKEKLTKALNADFEGVRKLFTSGGFSDTPGFGIGRFTKDSEVGVYSYDSEKMDWYLNGRKDSATGNWYSLSDWSFDSVTNKWSLKKGAQAIDPVKGTWAGNSIFTTSKGLSIEVPSHSTGEPQVTFVRGIAGQISTFMEKAKTGYFDQKGEWVDGYLKQSKDKYQTRIDDIQKRVDLLQLRVDNYENRLIKQFAALEKSMSSLQAQSANMLSALGSMNNSSSKK